jgi:hypothetical protein
MLRWVLSTGCECFASLGSVYFVLPPSDPAHRPARLFEDTPEPSPCPHYHPERVRSDIPLTESELALLRQLVHQRWPAG